MKKAIIILSCLVFLISSCKTSSDVVSSGLFQKRKYTKGYNNNSRGVAKVKRQNDLTENYNYVEVKKDDIQEKKNGLLTENVVASNEKNVTINQSQYENVFKPSKKQNRVNNEDCGDKLILKSGDEIKAKILSVGAKELTYKKCNNIGEPSYTINKSDVFMIKYKNAEKDVFNIEPKSNKVNQIEVGSSGTIETFSLISFIAAISGVLSILLFFAIVILFAIIAVIFGIIGLNKIKKSNGFYSNTNKTFAWLGIILGGILLISLILIACFL